ncbi:hypothetical protein CL632_03015 [bacterium]|jgi:glycerophosphoryl diester phosphodiesterase|nr:hypothetical protein [bacterium]MDP6571837.1 glycerophosphodiester phosphodiesterase family protein [Patescibacteria group bacterium]|tara:strand:- start:6619 stop:7362 length:744 start_codon:yes stop_codon:yes gene_type:complete
MIIAHRGYTKQTTENTIAAFDAAILAGADAIETDVRLTQDQEVVISHDDTVKIGNQLTTISQTSLTNIKKFRQNNPSQIITLDELFEYIKSKKAEFFIELKQPSPVLLAKVIKEINKSDLWNRVHVIGFSQRIKTALASQKHFPKLLVDQIIRLPLWSYIQKPQKSNAIFIGWLDGVKYSESVFKKMYTQYRVSRFADYYRNKGFKVMGGVLNKEQDIRFFLKAGINDIFTDEVELAILCLKQPQQF